MNTIYRAHILISTESMDYDTTEKAYIGYDPDSYQIVDQRTIEAKTLEELKTKLNEQYYMNNALEEPQVFDGRIEFEFEGEHDYRTPKEEQIPFREIYSVVVEQLQVTQVKDDKTLESLFKKGA